MRAETLKDVLNPSKFEVIDTHIPFYKSHVLFRSMAFRYKKGPLISSTNNFILQNIGNNYDLIWVDKAIFIEPEVTKQLRQVTKLLIHYTPDTAFEWNQSIHFYNSLKYYDYCITTKSFEEKQYLEHIGQFKLILVPQGFDRNVHYPRCTFEQKEEKVIFIGLNEPSREDAITTLLKHKIKVDLAGKNWKSYVKKNNLEGLTFLGESLFKDDYAKAISGAMFGLGLLSKRFSELHTTRTFEIPACGTALLTECNVETEHFFDKDEAIFFSTYDDMAHRILHFIKEKKELQELTQKGHKKVIKKGYDYQSELQQICHKIGIIEKN
jgi:spore maturation protein CgeB